MEDTLLKEYLEKHHIMYTNYDHAPVHTVAESNADETVKKIPGARGKTLFLRDKKGTFYLVGLSVSKRLDFKRLVSVLGTGKLSMGTPEELKELTTCVPGSVSIFGAVHNKHVFLVLDQALWKEERVTFHPNRNTSSLVLTHEELEAYYDSLPNPKQIIAL